MSNEKTFVFVSHASQDVEVVKRLKERLRIGTKGALFFSDTIPAGSEWNRAIREGLCRADAVLVLVSQHSERSQWVSFEIGYASAKDKLIIPIMSPGDLPSKNSPLDQLQQIEINSADALVEIVRRIDSKLGRDLSADFHPQDIDYIFDCRLPNLGAISLTSRDDIYLEIARLIKAGGKDARIRATSTFIDPEWDSDPAFDNYLENIAGKIRDAKQQGGMADYMLVMSFEIDESAMPSQGLQQSIRNRQSAFKRVDAFDRIAIYRRGEQWRIEVFILGESDVIFGFPSSPDSSKLDQGVHISGRDFVLQIINWFETCLLAGAAIVNPTTLKVHPVPASPSKSAEGIDSLRSLVSGAKERAEQLGEHREASSDAWEEVSVLEEGLAIALPISEPEGRIARRGAVRAALKAGDHARARLLTQRYLAEEAPDSLRATLREMLEADAHA